MKLWRCKCGAHFAPLGADWSRDQQGGDPSGCLRPFADKCPRCGAWVPAPASDGLQLQFHEYPGPPTPPGGLST